MKDDLLLEYDAKWKPVPVILLRNRHQMKTVLTEESLRTRVQFYLIYIIFFLVSLGMTLVNRITGWELLMKMTLCFSGANLINAGLCMICRRTEQLASWLLAVEILVLFTVFLIFGEPEGFSAIWAALLPACGLLLYGIRYGSFLSALQFAIIVLLFWTDWGRSQLQYAYTESFLLRFPLLYTAFFAVGFLFEGLRSITQNRLREAKEKYQALSRHDALTGLYNRYGFNLCMDRFLTENASYGGAFAIVDLDFFKTINDRFGHQSGDEVLKSTAADLQAQVGENGIVCRWGGEEFAILFYIAGNAPAICKRILEQRRQTRFEFLEEPTTVTVSIGLLEVPAGKPAGAADIVNAADENLYKAKQTGRDKLVSSRME